MQMRKRVGSVLFTAASAAAVVGLSVGPALAATSLTVKVSGGGSYTAKAGTTVLSDNGVSVTCKSSKAIGQTGQRHLQGQAPRSKLGTVSNLGFTNCSGPLGAVTNDGPG